jgi:hypothetical protein
LFSVISKDSASNFERFGYGVAILLLLYISLFTQPGLIGPWEAFHFFNSFYDKSGPQIIMGIYEGADTAGHHGPFNYGLVNFYTYFVNKLGIVPTTFAVRLLSELTGLMSLALFFVISRRWFGGRIALAITLLFGINETFLLYEHTLVPQMFTMLGILMLTERFQALYEKSSGRAQTIGRSITLGLACAYCALNYAFGRIFLVFILLLQFKMIFTDIQLFSIAKNKIRKNTFALIITWVSFLLALLAMYPNNIRLFFAKKFLFNDLGEYATSATDYLSYFKFNAPFIWNHLLLGRPFLAESIPFFTMGDAKYQLIAAPILVLFILGLFCALRDFTREIFNGQKNLCLTLVMSLLGILFLTLNMSLVYPINSDGTQNNTVVLFRAFYLCLPIFWIIGFAVKYLFSWLRAISPERYSNIFFFVIFCPVFIHGVAIHLKNLDKLNDFVESHTFDFSQPAPRRDFVTEQLELEKTIGQRPRMIETQQGIFLKNQVYMKKLAQKVAARIREIDPQGTKKLAMELPLDFYTPRYYHLCCGLAVRPYLKLFLSVYLFDFGIPNSYLDDSGQNRFDNARLYVSTSPGETVALMAKVPGVEKITLN